MAGELTKLYFEDYQVGDEFTTDDRTITESDIVNFAGLSGDFNPLHMSEVFGQTTLFKGRVAHGLLGLAVQSGLMSQTPASKQMAVMAFLGLTWRFTGPIMIGDTIHVRSRVKEKRETSKPDRGLLLTEREVINQRGAVVQKGEVTLMVQRKVHG